MLTANSYIVWWIIFFGVRVGLQRCCAQSSLEMCDTKTRGARLRVQECNIRKHPRLSENVCCFTLDCSLGA